MPNDPEADDALDAVALTLAVWLGVIAGVTGIVRLSEQAAMQADIARTQAGPGLMITTKSRGPGGAAPTGPWQSPA